MRQITVDPAAVKQVARRGFETQFLPVAHRSLAGSRPKLVLHFEALPLEMNAAVLIELPELLAAAVRPWSGVEFA